MKIALIHDLDELCAPDELIERFREDMDRLGNYFPWDVLDSVHRARQKRLDFIRKKIAKILVSEEFILYYSWCSNIYV